MDNRSSQKPQKAFQKANRFCSTFLSWHSSKSGIGIGKKKLSLGQKFKLPVCNSNSCFTKYNPYLTPKSIPQSSIEVFYFHVSIFISKSQIFNVIYNLLAKIYQENHVSNQILLEKNGYITSMLPSKVMPYLFRLAAPLMDSSIVQNFYNSR